MIVHKLVGNGTCTKWNWTLDKTFKSFSHKFSGTFPGQNLDCPEDTDSSQIHGKKSYFF